MRKLLLLCVVLAGIGWFLSAPSSMTLADLPAVTADLTAGERIFWAGGCASCHTSPDADPEANPEISTEARGDSAINPQFRLGGGQEFDTPYGIFRAPNISSDPVNGIGAWSTLEFVNAMQRGVSPDGSHYYPVFPYTSYARMATEEVIHLKAFMDTLPPVTGVIADHALTFPWNVRRGLGLWKRRYLKDGPIVSNDGSDPQVELGRSLVEGPGHCGQCHTPRDAFGGLQLAQWLAGAPDPEGRGKIPNITPASTSIGEWSVDDLEYYFESGFTPDYDTAGGTMVAVQENLSNLSPQDRAAIAIYLKTIPALSR